MCLDIQTRPDQTKAKKAIAVPLSKTAMVLITEQKGCHSQHVFTYFGKPVKEVYAYAWRNALK